MPQSGREDIEVAPVRAGEDLNWPRLRDYLRDRLPQLDGDFTVLQFPNGFANLTYLVAFGNTKVVVRRPPFGALAPAAHDMRREFIALRAISDYFDRAPRPYLFCDDHSVIGSDFLVVEYRAGVVVWDHIPRAMEHHVGVGRRVGLATIDALADLHLLVPDDVGLGNFGRPLGFVERQVTGWRKRWELVDVGRVPQVSSVAVRLAASIPPARGSIPRLLHNDFKIDNCQFDPDNPDRVTSIFDWDMAARGEPLVDLGILLNYWPDPADHAGDRSHHKSGLEHLGLPSREEVVEHYSSRTGADTRDIAWYEAFAAWKTCVVLEQLYQRYVRGESTDPRMGERGAPVGPLADRAARLLDRVAF